MFRTCRLNKFVVSLTALVAVLALGCPSAEAQVKPFKVSGGGFAPDGIPVFPGGLATHDATGTATHLGKYTGNEGLFKLLTIDFGTLSGTFEGSFVFVAANGDRLKCNYRANPAIPETGTFSVSFTEDGQIVVTFIQEFTPVPAESTGQFATVTGGSFIMIATTEAFPLVIGADGYTLPFHYTWEGIGFLEFAK